MGISVRHFPMRKVREARWIRARDYASDCFTLATPTPRRAGLRAPQLLPNKTSIMKFTRRQFIGAGTAAVIVAGMKAQGRVFGANNRIRVCTMGFNGRGGAHLKEILALKQDAEYTALV